MFYVYLLKSEKDNSIYIDCSNDLRRRLDEHNSEKVRSTKAKTPWELVYYEAYSKEHLAYKREKSLKYHGRSLALLKTRIGL